MTVYLVRYADGSYCGVWTDGEDAAAYARTIGGSVDPVPLFAKVLTPA